MQSKADLIWKGFCENIVVKSKWVISRIRQNMSGFFLTLPLCWIFPDFATLWIFPDFATLWLCGDQTQYFFADQTQCGGLVTKTRILHECLRFWSTGDKYAGLSPVGIFCICAGVGIINGWREHTRSCREPFSMRTLHGTLHKTTAAAKHWSSKILKQQNTEHWSSSSSIWKNDSSPFISSDCCIKMLLRHWKCCRW